MNSVAKDPDDNDIIDVSDGDSDATLDSDGDTDPENDPTETLITQSPEIEVTKTYRIVEKTPELVPFGGVSGNSLDNWVTNQQSGLNDGFISSRSISKPGEYFEILTRGIEILPMDLLTLTITVLKKSKIILIIQMA